VIVRDSLHRLLDQLVAFVFQTLSVAVLASVDTAAVVVVLRRRGRGSAGGQYNKVLLRWTKDDIPVPISRDDIVDLELLGYFFDAEMEGVRLELFAGHIGEDGSWETHEASGLILGRVAPTVSLLATLRAIEIRPLRAAATLNVVIAVGEPIVDGGVGTVIFGVCRVGAEATHLPQGDVVGTGDALISPRHLKWALALLG
jgi:hypothetical protein